MVDFLYKDHYDVNDLKKLVKVLRSPEGCPWDREQTHASITRDFIEEVYEVVEAISENSTEHLKEELGDVLLQVVFHADIEEDAGRFTLEDAADGVCKKLILRHPHVFSDVTAETSEEVLKNWDDIKRKEKNQETVTGAMKAVATSLPALWRAEKVQKKAAKAGFDWDSVDGALDKLQEEIAELREAIAKGEGIDEEMGDLLFSAVNASRLLKRDPEAVLTAATDKFIARFELTEQLAAGEGGFEGKSLEELDKLWDRAKAQLREDSIKGAAIRSSRL